MQIYLDIRISVSIPSQNWIQAKNTQSNMDGQTWRQQTRNTAYQLQLAVHASKDNASIETWKKFHLKQAASGIGTKMKRSEWRSTIINKRNQGGVRESRCSSRKSTDISYSSTISFNEAGKMYKQKDHYGLSRS